MPKFLTHNKRLASLYKEQGSALVLVMFIVLLLTILGLAVLSAAVGGAQRSETRENDVQTLHLTEKSLDEAVSYITIGLNNKALDPKELESAIRENIDNLLKNKDLSVSTDLDNAAGKITGITFDKSFLTGKQSLKYYVTIKASAEVNGVVRELQQQLIIDAYPDFLKYALGSEGNVILNGAPLIQGNLYVGKELLINDQANYIYRGSAPQSQQTVFPKLAHLTANDDYGEIHVQALSNIKFARGHITANSSSDGYMSVNASNDEEVTNNNLNEVLGIENSATANPLDEVMIKQQKKFVQIDVSESFLDKIIEASGATRETFGIPFTPDSPSSFIDEIKKLEAYGSKFEILNNMEEPVAPNPDDENYDVKKDDFDNLMLDYNSNLNKLVERSQAAIFDDNLLVDGIGFKKLTYTQGSKNASQWFIVKGNLTINNQGTETLPVRGNILVTGDVLIRGKVDFDCTMFVLGKATVEDAVIHGLDHKQLVLISRNKLLVNRVDKFKVQAPDWMDAFFYTEDEAELYGVGSTLYIKGGFFSKKDLTINAVVGQVYEPTTAGSSKLSFISPTSSDEEQRFKVIYDESIYEAQQAGLPRVSQINVTTSPIQLVPLSTQSSAEPSSQP